MPAAEDTGDFIVPAASNKHCVSGPRAWYHSRSKRLSRNIQSEVRQSIPVNGSIIWSLLQNKANRVTVLSLVLLGCKGKKT